MKNLINGACCLLIIFTFASCGGGGGNSSDNKPKTGEEAVAKLSPLHKQNFKNWQQNVVKACDASSIFGVSSDKDTEYGIDGSLLIQKNDSSVIFSDADNLAIITAYHTFSGIGSTSVDESLEVNGEGYKINAETKREGSYCTVYLYGQKVYEVKIAESFVIGAEWSVGKAAQASATTPEIRALGTSGAYEVVHSEVFNLLAQSLRPSTAGVALVAKKLGIEKDQATRLFRLSDYTSTNSAIRIAEEASAVWSNKRGNNLIAGKSVLSNIFDGNDRNVSLEVRLAIPRFSFNDIKNSADEGNLELTLSALISKKEDNLSYSTQSLQSQGLIAFNEEEAIRCTNARLDAYLGSAANTKQIQPSVEVMFSPCRSLHVDIEDISYKNSLMKEFIPEIFAGVEPSLQFQYGGWDQVLSKLALTSINDTQGLRKVLDPHYKTKIVPIIADHLKALNNEIALSQNLLPSKDAIFQMGLGWSFAGEIVADSRIALILQTIDSSIDPFRVSSEKLLASLGRDPNAFDRQLIFAQGIDADYKKEALKALALAKGLSYTDFEMMTFDVVIQREIPIDEFKEATVNFTAIKSKINKYSNITNIKGKLVGLSLRWLKLGEASIEDLDVIYAGLNNSAVPFEESTKKLLSQLKNSLADNREAVDFARSISPEYKKLAIVIREKAKTAENESWGESFFAEILQKRPDLAQVRAWDNMWTAALAFTQREKGRTEGEFGSTNDWNREKVMKIALEESWSQSEFTGLESIAKLARAKSMCERHKGASSLANCAGLKFFSVKSGKFFDPNFNKRYIVLSKDFTRYMTKLSGFDWNSLRRELLGKFFGSSLPIWSQCNQDSFYKRSSALKKQVNAVVRETSQTRIWERERQIKKTIKNCNEE